MRIAVDVLCIIGLLLLPAWVIEPVCEDIILKRRERQ